MDNDSKTEIDTKTTKRHYPTDNTTENLEFCFPKDPHLFLCKNNILIRGTIEVDQDYVIENGFASKLFSTMTVEVDSQVVTFNKTR